MPNASHLATSSSSIKAQQGATIHKIAPTARGAERILSGGYYSPEQACHEAKRLANHARAPSWADSFASTALGKLIVPERLLTRAPNGQCVSIRSSHCSPAGILQRRLSNASDSDGPRPRVRFVAASKGDARPGSCQPPSRKGEPLVRRYTVFGGEIVPEGVESLQVTLDSESNAFATFDSVIGTDLNVRARRSRTGRECTQRAQEGVFSNVGEASAAAAARCRSAADRIDQ